MFSSQLNVFFLRLFLSFFAFLFLFCGAGPLQLCTTERWRHKLKKKFTKMSTEHTLSLSVHPLCVRAGLSREERSDSSGGVEAS